MYLWLNWVIKRMYRLHVLSTKAKKRIVKTQISKFLFLHREHEGKQSFCDMHEMEESYLPTFITNYKFKIYRK